jgi:hypothetical protein
MSDYDNVTKLALLIDADNAQLSVINLVLPEIWHSSCEAGIDPSGYSIILAQHRRRKSQYGAALNFPTINRAEYQSI